MDKANCLARVDYSALDKLEEPFAFMITCPNRTIRQIAHKRYDGGISVRGISDHWKSNKE